MKKNIYIVSLYTALLTPVVSFAAPLEGLKGLLEGILVIINLLIPVSFGVAILFFFWGLIQFIRNAGDSKTREDGKQKILWGIIALFVMVAIYGILNWVGKLVGIDANIRGNGGMELNV